ncbi:MAG: PorT family protein [Prevotellaceae bacterium]|jgi:hypothetical protein|nr:PorT family protein [Prevotellaceae bacterium]
MKKYYLTIVAFFVFSIIQAQELPKNIFGIRTGINFSSSSFSTGNISFQYVKDNYRTKTKINILNFGLSYQRLLNYSKNWYLEIGLYVSDKGFEQEYYMTHNDTYDKYKTNLWYLQVPFLFNYHFAATDKITIEPFAGLYTAYGIDGKTKLIISEPPVGGPFTPRDVVNSFGNKGFKKFDMGLKFGIGATFYGVHASIEYEFGLLDIGTADYYAHRDNVKNKNFAIMLGYSFTLSKNKNVKDKFNRIYPNAE